MKHERMYNENSASKIVKCGKCKEEFMSLEDSSTHSCPHCGHGAEIELIKAEEGAL